MDIPSYGNDTSQLPHNSAGPRVNATDWPLLALAAMFLSLRIGCKLKGRRSLWWDDYVLIMAFVFLTISCIVMSVMISRGYGKHSWDVTLADIIVVQPLILVRSTFTVTAAVWSKTSFALTIYKLSTRRLKWALLFIIVSMNVAMGLSCVFSWVTCSPIRKAWNPSVDGTCWSLKILNNYSIFASAYSGFMDIVLATIPWILLWDVQIRPKEKIGVMVAMSMGILAGIVAFIKCAEINRTLSADKYDTAQLLIWDVAEISVTIVAASIPALRLLIREANLSVHRYYATEGTRDTGHSQSRNRTSRRATVIESARTGDDQSDKSILNSPEAGEVFYRTEITIENASKSTEEGFELSERVV